LAATPTILGLSPIPPGKQRGIASN